MAFPVRVSIWIPMLALVVAGLAGCGGTATAPEAEPAMDEGGSTDPLTLTDDPEASGDAEAPGSAPVDKAPAKAAPGQTAPTKMAPTKGAPTSAVPSSPAAPARPATLTLPAGTRIAVEFWREISSAEASPGERFRATVIEPVMVDQWVAVPVGAVVSGNVVDVSRGKKIGGTSSLTVQFTQIKLESGEKFPISASFMDAGKSDKKKDAATIGGAAAGGAVIGRTIGDDKSGGTAVGAVVGAAIGTAIAAKTQGQPVVIAEGMVLDIVLDAPVAITAGG